MSACRISIAADMRRAEIYRHAGCCAPGESYSVDSDSICDMEQQQYHLHRRAHIQRWLVHVQTHHRHSLALQCLE